ncbi:MAG: flagellar basal body rod protein FlgC, partial [Rhodobacteraceae bacterium]|nr:flagellar basal body rod protein FlgC [Paracoccaceae bacterium]
MADLFSTFAIAASGMDAQSRRMRHVTENIANADTPGYRRKSID